MGEYKGAVGDHGDEICAEIIVIGESEKEGGEHMSKESKDAMTRECVLTCTNQQQIAQRTSLRIRRSNLGRWARSILILWALLQLFSH